jgi:hypothetical protein
MLKNVWISLFVMKKRAALRACGHAVFTFFTTFFHLRHYTIDMTLVAYFI